jgi:hypothetical protein
LQWISVSSSLLGGYDEPEILSQQIIFAVAALHPLSLPRRPSSVMAITDQGFCDRMAQAFIELRRFDEAVVAGKKAQRKNSSFSTRLSLSRVRFRPSRTRR